MNKKLSTFASSMVTAYLILFAMCTCVYLMTWFVTMTQPNLNIASWSELERFLLFLYLFAVAPTVAYRIHIGKFNHNIIE